MFATFLSGGAVGAGASAQASGRREKIEQKNVQTKAGFGPKWVGGHRSYWVTSPFFIPKSIESALPPAQKPTVQLSLRVGGVPVRPGPPGWRPASSGAAGWDWQPGHRPGSVGEGPCAMKGV